MDEKSIGYIRVLEGSVFTQSSNKSQIDYWVGVNGGPELLEKTMIKILKDSINITVSSAFNYDLTLSEMFKYYLGPNICRVMLDLAGNGEIFMVDNNNKEIPAQNIILENFSTIYVEDFREFSIQKFLDYEFPEWD